MRTIRCAGNIIQNGDLTITEQGFVYSKTNTNPKIGLNGCIPISVRTDGRFTADIKVEESSDLYVNAYAINALGTGYSFNTQYFRTITLNKATIMTRNLKKIIINNTVNYIEFEACEVGTQNTIVISGTTTVNDETVFNNLRINQTSFPSVSNPIKSWTGLQRTFMSNDINFIPLPPNSLSMTHTTTYNCGYAPTSDDYNIVSSNVTESVYPYLWEIKDDIPSNFEFYLTGQLVTHGGPTNSSKNYFYYNATLSGGKLVEKKKTSLWSIDIVIPYYTLLIFAYPSDYGNLYYKWEGDTVWGIPKLELFQQDVVAKTGDVGIVSGWTKKYNVVVIPTPENSGIHTFQFKHEN